MAIVGPARAKLVKEGGNLFDLKVCLIVSKLQITKFLQSRRICWQPKNNATSPNLIMNYFLSNIIHFLNQYFEWRNCHFVVISDYYM